MLIEEAPMHKSLVYHLIFGRPSSGTVFHSLLVVTLIVRDEKLFGVESAKSQRTFSGKGEYALSSSVIQVFV